MVPVILVWLGWRLRWHRAGDQAGFGWAALASRITVTVAVIGACILPWTVRNYRAFGEVVLLNTNAGFAFFWGNHPIHGTDFIPILPNNERVNYQTLIPHEFHALNEAQLDRALLLRGLEFITSDPVRYVRLSISRSKEYIRFWPTPDSGALSNLTRIASFAVVLPLLLYGFAQVNRFTEAGRGAGGSVLILSVAALYSLVHLLTWTLVRYRLPVDAMTMPFAGIAIVTLFQRAANRAPVLRTSVRLSEH
jgi:hypothetical protein